MDKIKTNLEKKGYKVTVFDTATAAKEYLLGEINGTTVGIGGSMTVEEMGLYEELKKDNLVYWHWKAVNGESVTALRDKAATTEVYISSVNGIAETGEIINIDGTGNRVAATIYGHKKVYLIVGQNKIAPDYEQAMWRARNIASPLNAKRLGIATPCAVNGDRCYDCESPARICRAFGVLACAPGGSEYEVVLVKENLGY